MRNIDGTLRDPLYWRGIKHWSYLAIADHAWAQAKIADLCHSLQFRSQHAAPYPLYAVLRHHLFSGNL